MLNFYLLLTIYTTAAFAGCIKFTNDSSLCALYLGQEGVYVHDNTVQLFSLEDAVIENVFVTHSAQCTPEAINMYCAIHMPPCIFTDGIEKPAKICRSVCDNLATCFYREAKDAAGEYGFIHNSIQEVCASAIFYDNTNQDDTACATNSYSSSCHINPYASLSLSLSIYFVVYLLTL